MQLWIIWQCYFFSSSSKISEVLDMLHLHKFSWWGLDASWRLDTAEGIGAFSVSDGRGWTWPWHCAWGRNVSGFIRLGGRWEDWRSLAIWRRLGGRSWTWMAPDWRSFASWRMSLPGARSLALRTPGGRSLALRSLALKIPGGRSLAAWRRTWLLIMPALVFSSRSWNKSRVSWLSCVSVKSVDCLSGQLMVSRVSWWSVESVQSVQSVSQSSQSSNWP